MPSPLDPPAGCHFQTRCPFVADACKQSRPLFEKVGEGHHVACLRQHDIGFEQMIDHRAGRNEILEKLMRAFVEKTNQAAGSI